MGIFPMKKLVFGKDRIRQKYKFGIKKNGDSIPEINLKV